MIRSLLVMVLLCAFSTPVVAAVEKGDTLRVLVWNAWRGGNEVDDGPEKVLAVIRDVAPDLVLMQESYDIDADEQGDRPTLGRWIAGELGWSAHQGDSPHLCILGPRPFETTWFHDPWHGVGVEIRDEVGRGFVAWDIWLDWRSFVTYELRDRPEATDAELLACENEKSSRLAEVTALLAEVESVRRTRANLPTLVGGDFNCPSHLDWTRDTARVYRNRRDLDLPVSIAMRDAGFVDAFRVVHPDPVQHPGITWSPMFRERQDGSPQGFERIDRLYLRNPAPGQWALRPVAATVLPDGWEDESVPVRGRVFPSDHGAVVVDLEWRRVEADLFPDRPIDDGTSLVPDGQTIGYAEEVKRLAEASRTNQTATGGTMLVGSSIFRLWKDAEIDLAEFDVVNHGFGGSRSWELLEHAPTLIEAFRPRTIVVYCGSNDVNANEPADRIVERLRRFTTRMERAMPGVHIVHVSINRAPQKQDRWDVVDAANAAIESMCEASPTRWFVDVNEGLFDAAGEPRVDLYLDDRLHFTDAAYDEVFLPRVRSVLRAIEEARPPTP